MSERLLDSSVTNDASGVSSVDLLSDIKSAWDQITQQDRDVAFNQMQKEGRSKWLSALFQNAYLSSQRLMELVPRRI